MILTSPSVRTEKNKQRRDKTSQDKSQSKTGLTSDGEDANIDERVIKTQFDFRHTIYLKNISCKSKLMEKSTKKRIKRETSSAM